MKDIVLVIAACIIFGFIIGFTVQTILSLLIWFGFWSIVGVACVYVVDVLAGLSAPVCRLRARIRTFLFMFWLRRAEKSASVVAFRR